MRRLGPAVNVLRATINLGINTTESTKAPSLWTRIWDERDVQIMVLISLALQLFLLLAGNIRRWRRVGWLRLSVWLAYLAAYAVATSAIGLFSRYEDKYKLRSLESFEHLHILTLPFLWAPFLLLHLGGPDTITAFSIEDNNLWMRQLINLVFQLGLALYVFWKSFDLLDAQLLTVAVPLFVAGIIKCGERIRALQRGSRDSLDCCSNKEYPGPPIVSRALNSALSGRGLLVGRSVDMLSEWDEKQVLGAFEHTDTTEGKLKIILNELGMIYDILYTKTLVLQCLVGGIFRCIALVSMVTASVLFFISQHKRANRTANAAITYTLFGAAIIVEIYSILMMIASPWTRARSKFVYWLSCKLACCFPCQKLPIPSMGQFNLIDYSWSKKSIPKFMFEVPGLDKHWTNFWHIKHVEGMEIVNYIVELFDTGTNPSGEGSRHLELGSELKYMLAESFENCLFNLHIFTEKHIRECNLLEGGGTHEMEKMKLVAQCRKLSNYLMYLMAVYPSKLPVGVNAQGFGLDFADWVRHGHGNMTKAQVAEKYVNEVLGSGIRRSPFTETPSVDSLKDMREVWVRLLIYAAGKCPMELHAQQLGDGGVELLTVVGYLLLHQRLGDAGLRKVERLAPSIIDPLIPHDPLHEAWPAHPYDVFEFIHDDHNRATSVRPLSSLCGPSSRTRPNNEWQPNDDAVEIHVSLTEIHRLRTFDRASSTSHRLPQ